MEEDGKDIMNLERPGKLNFNAPLLSTRRPIGLKRLEMPGANSLRVSLDFSERIPFSWEQTPGKPKKIEAGHVQNVDDFDLPPPNLPPCRWLQTKEASIDGTTEDQYDYDNGFDGDVEDYCNKDDVDAIDIFSLGQSVDVDEPGDEVEMFGFKGLQKEDYRGSHSPNFIIQRFLPDAKALAASSALNFSNTIEDPPSEHSSRARTGLSRAISVKRSFPKTKGCGINIFFPWRMKPKPCSTKNPVLTAALREKPQVQCIRRDK